MARRRLRIGRIGFLLLGILAGLIVTLGGVYLYVQHARTRVIEERVRIALGLPARAFTLEKVEPDGTLRIALHDVAFLDRNRDTILSAPLARARLLATTLNGHAPVVFDQGEVIRPFLRLSRDRKGEWNALQIFAVEAAGKPVNGVAGQTQKGTTFEFRGIRLVDGRVRMVTPATAPAPGPPPRYASGRTPETVRYRGQWLSVHTLSRVNGDLALVRVKGEGGWRVDIGSFTADVANPDTRIEALAGSFDQDARQNLRFAIRELRTTHSTLDGNGVIALAGKNPEYDVHLRAHPLDLRDLAGMGFPVPREGTARFGLAVRTLPAGRMRFTVTDAQVAILDSRASGHLTAVYAPGEAPVFTDTRIRLDPLRIVDLETLGFIAKAPLGGELTGTIASVDAVTAARGGGASGTLALDLSASLVPRTTVDAAPSVITARGNVRIGGAASLEMEALRVEAQPLELATLRGMFPANAAMLRGAITGGAIVSGNMKSLRIESGDLAYAVGNAPETRLRALNGTVTLSPAVRFSLDARADPLALATLTELFPSLPFRSATLTGPIHLAGTPQNVAFDFDLNGSAGGIAARGTLGLGGAAPTFDVSGRVSAFRASGLVANAPAAANELSGTFAARGSTGAFHFDVNLTQAAAGHFALAGSIRRPAGAPMEFDVAGRVDNFQIGALLGKPTLLPGPVTGPIRVSGGGRQPYRFDVDLRGPQGAFALNGWFQPGTVPSYSIRGSVGGLDLSALPGLGTFPRTRLTGTVALDGRGTTPQTFVGTVAFDAAPGSTVGGIALTAGTLHLHSDGGALQVDTLMFAGRGFLAQARGAIGINRNAGPLTFALNAPNLAQLRALLPGGDTLPDVAGSVSMNGSASGTLANPSVAVSGQASGFHYATYAAQSLSFTFNGSRVATGWTGRVTLNGTGLQSGTLALQALNATVEMTPGRATFTFSARRDADTDLAAAGTLEMDGLAPHAADLDALTLRIAGTQWQLAQPARIGFSADEGLAVSNLVIRRTGAGATGVIQANGVLPAHGTAAFTLHMEGIDLAEAQKIFPSLPAAQGRLALDANVQGPVNDPRLTIDARVDSLRYGGVASDSVQIRADYAGGRMAVNGGVRVGGRVIVDAVASVPMRLTLGGTVPGFELLRDQPLSATVTADSVPLALITQTFPAYVKNGAGTVHARVLVAGTPRHPTVSGDASVVDGTMEITQLGATWNAINGSLSLRGDTVRIDSLTARTGADGHALVNGTVLLDDATRPLVNVALTMKDFNAANNPQLARLQADANVRLAGRFPAIVATGTVAISDGTIAIPSLNQTREADIVDADVGALGADTMTAPSTGQQILGGLVPRNLRVTIGDRVWLQSADAHIQITGRLVIDRPAETNLIYGELDAVRGTYNVEFGPIRRTFDIQQGVVRFYGTPDLNPSLDITASNQVPGSTNEQPVVVLVHLTGTVQQPRVELTTNNRVPLSQSELASLLLFGQTTGEGALPEELLSGVLVEEALANYLAAQLENQLVRTGLVDFVRVQTRGVTGAAGVGGGAQAFGLDFLGPVTIELGKEIVNNVYLTAELVDLFSNQPQLGAGIDWQITPTLSLRAADEPVQRDPLVRSLFAVKRQVTVDLRRRWEYGRPRVRPHPLPRRNPDTPAPAEPSTPSGQPPPAPPPPSDDDIEGG